MARNVCVQIEGPAGDVVKNVMAEIDTIKPSRPTWQLCISQGDPKEHCVKGRCEVAIYAAEITDGDAFQAQLQRIHEYGAAITVAVAVGGTAAATVRLQNWCSCSGVIFTSLPDTAAPVKGLGDTIVRALEESDQAPRVCGIFPDDAAASPQAAPQPLIVIVLGASGDLAKKKTFPALVRLYFDGLLRNVRVVGYARSALDRDKLSKNVRPFINRDVTDDVVASFFDRVSFVAGSYSDTKDFEGLDTALRALEGAAGGNRLFYLALPPTVFVDACTGISRAAQAPKGWTRVIVEKPFGHDLESSNALSASLGALLDERQIFRIDHYLGKEMVQNMVTLRFANKVFSSVWNCDNISTVQITFKETIGTQGRGGYFDKFGIVRDVIQNHLTQLFALVSMEKPQSLSAEHIRDAKVAVLNQVLPIDPRECVLGQYTASPDGSMPGYLDDPTVPKGSVCPTFAYLVLRVRNDRWRNVPFVFKAGKALEAKAVTVRVQFHDELVPFGDLTRRNELVVRAQPDEAMYLKITTKRPGTGSEVQQSELDLSYKERFSTRLPDAYESLIHEAIKGNSTNFVRSDELEAAWRIFTPLLKAIDRGEMRPEPYPAGSRGPPQADKLTEALGYVRSSEYRWSKP